MKFSELKKDFSKEKLEQLKIDKYITLAEKMFILQGTEEDKGMVENVLEKIDNKLWSVNRFAYEMYLTYNVLVWYGNIEIDVDFDNDSYDFVHENGIFDYIIDKTKDYYKFANMLDDMIKDELEKRNSISAVLNRLGNQLIMKLEDMTDEEKMNNMMNKADEALKRFPFLKDIVVSDLTSKKKSTKGGKKKVK